MYFLKKMFFLFIFFFPTLAFSEEVVLISLNYCVSNNIDFEKDKIEVVQTNDLTIVCSKDGRLNLCKFMEKNEGASSSFLFERKFEAKMDLGTFFEMSSEKDGNHTLVFNKSLKKVAYLAKKYEGNSKFQNISCKGTYKDPSEVRNLIKPPSTSPKKAIPIEVSPAMIGE